MSHELQDYIKQARTAGHSDDDIRVELIKAGWSQEDVANAFATNRVNGAPAPVLTGQMLPGTFYLLKESFQQFAREWKQYIGLSLLPLLLVLPLIIGIVVFPFLSGNMRSNTGLLIFMGLLGLLFLIALVITSIWTQTALMYAIAHEGLTFRKSLRSGWHRILPLLWVYILSGLIVMAGYALLIIPGIILALNLFLAAFVMLKEDKRGLRAVVESTHLVKGYWWAIVGRVFLIWLLYVVVFTVPFLIIDSLTDDNRVATALSIIQQPFAFIFGIVFSIVVYRLYVHLRARKAEATADEVRRRITKYKVLLAIGLTFFMLMFVGMFAIIPVVALQTARSKAVDAQQISDVKQFQVALELYYADQGSYPVTPDTILIGDTTHDAFTSNGFEDDASISGEFVYLRQINRLDKPQIYYVSADGSTYTITFDLETGRHAATPQGIL